ncbi:MAG: membrane protein insertase YidC, partial [Gammaproteobacteria bacterium]|nr:membrane protein insertase YidC [Gammaproteobacteria bacterium]
MVDDQTPVKMPPFLPRRLRPLATQPTKEGLINVMDTNRTRLFFWAAIALVLAFLWTKWNALFAPPVPSAPAAAVQTVKSASLSDTVPVASPDGRPATSPVISALREGSPHLVIATTDLLRLSINPENGAIIEANLLQYPKTLGSKTPVQLLYRDESGQYIAQSGLIEADAHDHPLHFSSAKTNYVLTPGQQNLEIKLIGTEEGLKVTKTYTLHRNSYQIDVNYSIQNTAHQTWVGQLFGQIVRTPPTNDSKGLYTKVATFTGAAYSTPDAHYNTLSFKDMMNSNLQVSTQGGWAAMVDHYFISAWIPNAQDPSTYYSRVYDNHNFAVGSLSPTFSLAEGQQANWGGKFYVGPTLTDQLNQAAPYLSLTIDYGWLWFIAKYLFLLLQGIEALIKNWGWSIVILTLLIKLAFFPLSAKSYRSMAKMRVIAPKVKALQERFKDDRAQLSKAMMELYRKE